MARIRKRSEVVYEVPERRRQSEKIAQVFWAQSTWKLKDGGKFLRVRSNAILADYVPQNAHSLSCESTFFVLSCRAEFAKHFSTCSRHFRCSGNMVENTTMSLRRQRQVFHLNHAGHYLSCVQGWQAHCRAQLASH